MKTIKYHAIVDKAGWPSGPWHKEPDKIQFTDKATGLPCLIVRNTVGALCGYVGVSEGHPFFGVNYEDVDLSVHGGTIFSDFCQPGEHGICHIPGPGEPARVWWFGFDCAHAFDVVPRIAMRFSQTECEYRTIGYVRKQCAKLAKQLRRSAGDSQ